MGGRSPTLGSLICTKKNYWTHFYVKNCAMSSQRTAWIIFSLGRVIMDYVLYFLKKKTKNGLDANDNIIRLSFVYGKLSYAMFYRHKVHEGLVSTIITLLKRILLKTIKHVRSKKLALACTYLHGNMPWHMCYCFKCHCILREKICLTFSIMWLISTVLQRVFFFQETMSFAVSWL